MSQEVFHSYLIKLQKPALSLCHRRAVIMGNQSHKHLTNRILCDKRLLYFMIP